MSDVELFLDRHRISWEHNVDRQLQHPRKHEGNPILAPEYPWEASYVTIYGSVLPRAGGGMRMWYMSGAGGMRTDQMMCYAESDDGLSFTRIMSESNPYRGLSPTNIVLGPEPNVHGPSIIENHHGDDPDERYLLLYDSYPQHRPNLVNQLQDMRWVYSATSADGLRWLPRLGRPAIAGKSDVGQSVVWDPANRRYMAYLRGIHEPHGVFASSRSLWQRVRYVRAAWSSDFAKWSEPLEVFRCDEQDGDPNHQAHQLSVTRRGDQYVGILSIFRMHECIPLPHHDLNMEEGPIETQLLVSRDAIRWDRVANRQTFLQRGEPGAWDSYWLVTSDRIVYDGDRMLIYYAASGVRRCDMPDYNPQTPPSARYRIGVASLPRDRFQALQPRSVAQEAVLETKPLSLQPGELRLNADASHGRIAVELCDFTGRPIEGFGRDDCALVTGDSLDHVIRWRDRSLTEATHRQSVLQRSIRIRCYLHGASLFAMQAPWSENRATLLRS